MFDQYSEIAVLLVKALQGELTEDEKEHVRAWREEREENERLYTKVMSPEFVKMKSVRRKSVDSERAYRKVKRCCVKRERNRRFRYVFAVAASVLLFFGASVYYVTCLSSSDIEEGVDLPMVSGARAELILSGGERVELGRGRLDSVWMFEGTEVRSTEERVSYSVETSVGELRYNTLRVPRGGEYSVVLADGTSVYLNSESELRYPVQFGEGERRVFLQGEGYFEVTKDPGRRFVVEVGNSTVEVLGTSFNVSAYDGEKGQVVTTLVEGRVLFSSGDRSLVLNPDEQGIADAEGHLFKERVDVFPYVAWQRGKFVFRQQTLEEVMRVTSRWYDVEVVFEDEYVKKISFTGNIRRYGDFKQVVRMLEKTGGLIFRIKDRTIYIAGK